MSSSLTDYIPLISKFFAICFLIIALFYLIVPYSWTCELITVPGQPCHWPQWASLLIAVGTFTLSYFSWRNWDLKSLTQ